MSDSEVFGAEGISHLVIEQMAGDAQLQGSHDATTIEVRFDQSTGQGTGVDVRSDGDPAHLTGAAAIRVIVPAAMTVTVKTTSGDFRVRQLAGDINLEAVHGDLRLAELSGVVRVAQVDADVRAEGVADLRLMGSCDGDLRFENGERLTAETVAGDVRVHNAGEIRLGRVRGNLWAEKIRDSLQVGRVDGDARLTEVSGLVNLRALAGDLRATALTGGLSAPQVSGDALLQGSLGSAELVTLVADGDVQFYLPAKADVHISVKAGGRLRSDTLLTPATDGSATFAATLGRGTTRVSLTSGGDLRLVQAETATGHPGRRYRPGPPAAASAADLSDLGEHIRQQVTASLAAAGIGVETGAMNSARPREEHRTSHERSRTGKEAQMPRSPTPDRPRPSSPPPGPSRDEETAVLKMLEDGTITPQEADVLLKALGA